jgi:Spy/CpxP family protein refolding chaperone
VRRVLSITFAVLLLSTLAASAQLAGRGSGPGGGGNQGTAPGQDARGQGAAALFRFLELTDDQQAQWIALHEEFRAFVEPIHEQQRALAEQLKALLETASPDPAAVGALIIQEYGLRERVREAGEQLQTDLKALLTPEQLIKYETFLFLRAIEGPPPCGNRP